MTGEKEGLVTCVSCSRATRWTPLNTRREREEQRSTDLALRRCLVMVNIAGLVESNDRLLSFCRGVACLPFGGSKTERMQAASCTMTVDFLRVAT